MPFENLNELKTEIAYAETDQTDETFGAMDSVINVKNPPEGFAPLIGDLAADDAPALQALVNSVSEGGILYFPPGQYRLLSPITLPRQTTNTVVGVVMTGAGPKSSILYSDNQTGCIIAKGVGTSTCNFVLRDLSVCNLNPTTNDTAIGLDMEYNNEYAFIDNVRFEAFSTTINIANNRNICISHTLILSSSNAGIKVAQTVAGLQVIGSAIRSCKDNIYLEGGTGHSFIACDISHASHCNIYAKNVMGLFINTKMDCPGVSHSGIYLERCKCVDITGVCFSLLAANAKGIWLELCDEVHVRAYRTVENASPELNPITGTIGILINQFDSVHEEVVGGNVVIESCCFARMDVGIQLSYFSGRIAAVDFKNCNKNFNSLTSVNCFGVFEFDMKHLRTVTDGGTSLHAVTFPADNMYNSQLLFTNWRRHGNLASRPTIAYNGMMYLLSNSNTYKPIFYCGGAWQYADGTVVT